MKGGRLMMLACVVALVAALGCGASQRADTIKAAYLTADSARDGFLAYDRAHELEMVQQAGSPDDAHAKLIAYQAKRAKVDQLFTGAYHAIAAAEILQTDASLTGMQAALAQLFEVLKPFLGGK